MKEIVSGWFLFYCFLSWVFFLYYYYYGVSDVFRMIEKLHEKQFVCLRTHKTEFNLETKATKITDC